MKRIDHFYRRAMLLDRCKHVLKEDAPVSSYNAAWEESYRWLLKKKDNVFSLPHDSVIKLKIDALAGVFEKVKINPDDSSDVIASNIDTLVSELQAINADEEPGEVKSFIERTVEAFRNVSYNANQGSADDLGAGGGGGSRFSDMGSDDIIDGEQLDGELEGGEEGDNISADLGIEDEDENENEPNP